MAMATTQPRKVSFDALIGTLETLCAAAANEAFDRYCREQCTRPLFLALEPSTETAFGRLFLLTETEDLPTGCEYVTPEHIPTHLERYQLTRWVVGLCRRLPMLPSGV